MRARLAAEGSHNAGENERVASRCCTVPLPIFPPLEIQWVGRFSKKLPIPLRRAGFKVPPCSPVLVHFFPLPDWQNYSPCHANCPKSTAGPRDLRKIAARAASAIDPCSVG